MYTLAMVLMSTLMCMIGVGCTGELGDTIPKDRESMTHEERAEEQKVYFEELRKRNREFLTTAAQKNPEKMGTGILSLMDYEHISIMEDFAKKYPDLQVSAYVFSVKGATHYVNLEQGKDLRQQIEQEKKRYMQRKLRNIKEAKENPNKEIAADGVAFEQKFVDALEADNVRTFGFNVIGKLKDLEAMAEQEYNKTVRVVVLSPEIDWHASNLYHEPIYASDMDPWKKDE